MGIRDGLVRLSVGLEHRDDLLADLLAALGSQPEHHKHSDAGLSPPGGNRLRRVLPAQYSACSFDGAVACSRSMEKKIDARNIEPVKSELI